MSHRQIDIDALNDDRYVDEFEALTTKTAEEVEAQVQTKAGSVRTALSRGNSEEALHIALSDPPYGKQFHGAQKLNGQVVMDVLNSVKSSDISSIIKTLSPQEIDTLAKYIYHGLAHPATYNCGVLLSWHEKVIEVGGLGTIVRVLSDNKVIRAQ
ncbi:arp2/3 complex subunit [Dimargaris cristalligena]|uniref:Actin-related protein 2/3 complex subunit 5 n=1 Tax=Dimargaris cristalligena TaxID=215637 RepID=A0A4V1J536_9FUNG|nr:arp2/3 complex subunit [Dimargaris cristalligena]RKP37689.1 actin-related protein 2/3 complex subunit 5 [Dimargaris cristalligena]|eukprot:RKP37689.1 actin-related protein 2/3 complex subunit 5 [Dimargaris cristalligena]